MAHKRITGMVTAMPSAVRHNFRMQSKIKESETNFYFHFRDEAYHIQR